MKVPDEGYWTIGTEAAGVFIVEGTLNWDITFEVCFNLGGRKDSVLIWKMEREGKDKRRSSWR
jgi:hypothetical protein